MEVSDKAERSVLADRWNDLPDHLITEILSFLPMEDVHRYRCICKQWNALLSSNNFINHIWAHAPINQQPWLVLSDDNPSTPCMAFCFYTRKWHTCFSFSFLEKQAGTAQLIWRGSVPGVVLADVYFSGDGDGSNDTGIVARVCNPYTQTFFQLSPMSKITTVAHKCIIMSNSNDKSVLSETHKVVALGWCRWEDSMKFVFGNARST